MAQFGSQDMTAVTKHLLLNINPLFQRKGVIKRTEFFSPLHNKFH